MNFLFRETYWAAILIIAGILLIIKHLFKVDIHVTGVVFSLILISWGISILVGPKFGSDGSNTVFFDGGTTTVNGESHHSVIFGKGDYDLRTATPGSRIDVDAVFGTSRVTINPAIPMKIKVSSAFGSGRLPDGSMITFGERKYTTPSYRDGEPYVELRCNVVFGELKVVNDPSSTL